MILNPQYIEKYFVEISEYEDYKLLIWVVIWIIFFVFFLIIFLIHLYVGKSAVKEARRGKNKYFYLIIAFVMILTSVSSIRNFMTYDSSDSDFDVAAVSIFMDITSAFLYIDMIYSSIRTKLLKRKLSHSRT